MNTLVESVQAMDLDAVMSLYAADVLSFDVEPPLQHVGAAAKRANWARVFSMYQRPLDYEIRDLGIAAGRDVAFAHGLVRIGGRLKDGTTAEHWLRSTTCLRKIAGEWVIAHDQISVPLDLETGRALLTLKP
jgi:ketosteroid isomerase-like protein